MTRSLQVFLLAVFVFGVKSLDPEANMDTTEIIERWDYPAEEHAVLTDDGYILTIHRIPYGKSGPSTNRPVVFFQHGLEDSSVSFIFADAGYDVWLGNMRGNTYGKDHVSLDPKSHDFWKFTFDEMAEHDLDAMINYVLKKTGQPQLYYVGHSQGTLTMFAKLSEDPAFAQKIKTFFALAPVGKVAKIQGLFDVVAHYLYKELQFFYYLFGDAEFLPTNELVKLIEELVCSTWVGGEFCDNFVMLIMGVNSNQLNVTRTPVIFSHIPAGTSTQNVLHWTQIKDNLKKYGDDTAPLYDLSKVNVNMYLYWSPTDWVADQSDLLEYLFKTLPKEYVKKITQVQEFNHMDFVWGKKAADQLYKPILEVIQSESRAK
ncbi:AB-hydrolase associated lipase region and Alpha beta hydrolase fold-1 domain containing protein [Aphelenchoides bicaudatus]|nr:AB-hydrolase associated lipase region and Alpha beta hydrolase fold-1 domain containing protein [Aphelenchoides bicaudatus]